MPAFKLANKTYRIADELVAEFKATAKAARAGHPNGSEAMAEAVRAALAPLMARELGRGIVHLSHECLRCAGSGKVVWRHVEGGRCFACDGVGKVTQRESGRQVARAWHTGQA